MMSWKVYFKMVGESDKRILVSVVSMAGISVSAMLVFIFEI